MNPERVYSEDALKYRVTRVICLEEPSLTPSYLDYYRIQYCSTWLNGKFITRTNTEKWANPRYRVSFKQNSQLIVKTYYEDKISVFSSYERQIEFWRPIKISGVGTPLLGNVHFQFFFDFRSQGLPDTPSIPTTPSVNSYSGKVSRIER